MDDERYNWISRRAHEIWQEEGQPAGRDRDHWSAAVVEREAFERLPPPPVSSKQAEPDTSAKSRTVLVVDDEPMIRYATMDALEQAGYDVVEAGNADEALLLLKQRPVDVVFTDINMPGSMDGLGLVSYVRETTPATRVIVTSGHVRLGRFDLASGVAFLPKPYRYDALITMLVEPVV